MLDNKETVYILEDDEAIIHALEWLFDSVQLKYCVFTDSEKFLKEYQTSWHGCILMDIRMPKMSGIRVQEELNAQNNKLPILFITGHGDIATAVRTMKAGAFDFITKPFHNETLLEQVQKAIAQSRRENSSMCEKENFNSLLHILSARERQILAYIQEGKLNKQIAVELNLSLSTIELHRANVMKKLHVKSLADLIKKMTLFQIDCKAPA